MYTQPWVEASVFFLARYYILYIIHSFNQPYS